MTHAIYRHPTDPEALAFDWMPRPWPGEDPERSTIPAARNAAVPTAWTVAAVFAVAPLDHFTMGTHAVIGAPANAPAFRLLPAVGDHEYTPADILRGNLPKGVTLLWKVE